MISLRKFYHLRFFFKLSPLLLILVQACSIQGLGQRFSNNFDEPIGTLNKENVISEKNDNKDSMKRSTKISNNSSRLISTIDSEKEVDSNYELREKNSKNKFNKSIETSKNMVKNKKFNPQPYRIIIKITGTNPSAPAETVTKALRQAGIKFEVEKIERYEVQSDSKNFPVNGQMF